ncbi:MAG: chemotaxis protein CheR, partial [Gammaproteobacteria bacterium]|nr:chemotaxis protein CheR [Gammaproteobacteria bacterium]
MESGRDFQYTEDDFQCIQKLVNHHTGITLSDAKQDMVYSRLSRRLRQLN